MSKKTLEDAMKKRSPLVDKPARITPVDLYSATEQPKAVEPVKVEMKPATKLKSEFKLYTTYISDAQKKKIKLHAIESEANDQTIVQQALDEYFKNHPL
jgi:hypothetical protein